MSDDLLRPEIREAANQFQERLRDNQAVMRSARQSRYRRNLKQVRIREAEENTKIPESNVDGGSDCPTDDSQ